MAASRAETRLYMPGPETNILMNETFQIAQFVHDTRYDDLPTEVIEACRVFLLDNLASALVGARTPWAKMVQDLARENGKGGQCSILGTVVRGSPPYAALANGTAIAGFETDQAYYPGSCHPGAVVLPALLAISENQQINGKRFFEAFALGYEAVCRIGRSAGRAVEDEAGFHGPGTNGPFGAAMAAGKAMWLGEEGLVNALGIAGSQGAGLMEFAKEGAMTKRLHLGRAAQTGLESALLADKGFTGPSTVLEGERGFLNVFSPTPDPPLLTRGLGKEWVLFGVSCKGYACHMSFHPVIERMVRHREESEIKADAITAVQVATNSTVVRKHGQNGPNTILGAQYSLPFSLAIALTTDIRDPAIFNESTLWDDEVRGLAEKVALVPFDMHDGPMADITIRSTAGETRLQATDWKGASSNPYTFDEMCDKFRTYAAGSLSQERIKTVIKTVAALENESDSGVIGALMTPDA